MSYWWDGMTCPKCYMEFTAYPALSRKDNKTYICSPCGVNEAMMDFVVYLRGKHS